MNINIYRKNGILNINSGGRRGAQGEAGKGVPTGGATGQVLSKKTDTDFDTEWRDDGLSQKANFPATNSSIPVRGSTGNQASLIFSVSTVGNSIPLRSSTGTVSVGEPTDNAHAATKKYVDDAIAEKTPITVDGVAYTGGLNFTSY